MFKHVLSIQYVILTTTNIQKRVCKISFILGIFLTCLLVLFVLPYDIFKTIKNSESHRFQLASALGYIGEGVVIGDMWQADGNLLCINVSDEPTEIVDDLTIIG